MQLKQRARVIAVIATILLLLTAVFVVTQLQRRLAPDDTSADAQNSLLIQKSAGPTGSMAVGNRFKVALKPNIIGTPAPSIAEIFVNFDQTTLKVISVVGGGGELIVLNTADGGNWSKGIVTADVAATGGNVFSTGQTLIEIEYEVLAIKAASTRISVASNTQLGLPNTLAASGYGTLDIPLVFSSGTSTATSTTTTAVSSSRSSSAASTTTTTTVSSSKSSTSTATVKTNELQVKLVTPAYSSRNIGDKFTVGVAPVIRGSQAKTAEIVLTYNRNVVRFVSASVANGHLAINQFNSPNTGRFTVDVATQGSTNFVSTAIILQVQFEVIAKTVTSTAIGIDGSSTLGVPDTLATNGYGSLSVPIGVAAQTSTNTNTQQPTSTATSTATFTFSTTSSGGFTSFSPSSTDTSSSAFSSFSFSETSSSETSSSGFSTISVPSSTASGAATSTTSTVTITPRARSLLGLDARIVVFILFALSGASGIAAGFVFLKKRRREQEEETEAESNS